MLMSYELLYTMVGLNVLSSCPEINYIPLQPLHLTKLSDKLLLFQKKTSMMWLDFVPFYGNKIVRSATSLNPKPNLTLNLT